MKEYKVMVKSIKTGEWVRASAYCHAGKFKNESDAVLYAKEYLRREQQKAYPNYNEYKIMAREVSPWENTDSAGRV